MILANISLLNYTQKIGLTRRDPKWVKNVLIGISLLFLIIFLILPLITIFLAAFQKGTEVYVASIKDTETLAAIFLTLITVCIALPLNLFFGVTAAWAISNFNFKGKNILITLIDIPLSVSPVIVGLSYVLVFGIHSKLGAWLSSHDIKIIFAIPGIVLSTIFVTFPLVAKQLIPLMQEQGHEEEEAALVLGATGWQTFWYITLPKIKWGLLYGVLLSNARAMGEFGAVSVVSGHIRGLTNTITLHIEILYNEYHFTAAFAVASLLTLLALVTLIIKSLVNDIKNQ